jgi:hypothetical protein
LLPIVQVPPPPPAILGSGMGSDGGCSGCENGRRNTEGTPPPLRTTTERATVPRSRHAAEKAAAFESQPHPEASLADLDGTAAAHEVGFRPA